MFSVQHPNEATHFRTAHTYQQLPHMPSYAIDENSEFHKHRDTSHNDKGT